MRYGLIFAGQGLQHADTLSWLADDRTTAPLQKLLGIDWRQRLADDGWAQCNTVAQPLLTGLAVCAWRQIAIGLPPPAAVAGYSVGELAAFHVAGVFDADGAMELAQLRATAMESEAALRATGMLGLSGLAPADLEAVSEKFGLALAIRSGDSTVVLGGPRDNLQGAAEQAREFGAHVTHLRIALASHTPWMRDAAAAFAQGLRDRTLRRPNTALISNASGARVADAASARKLLVQQIDQPVRWDACMDTMAELGVHCVLEVGAGCALARLWNARFPDTPARAADEFRSANAVRDWLVRHS